MGKFTDFRHSLLNFSDFPTSSVSAIHDFPYYKNEILVLVDDRERKKTHTHTDVTLVQWENTKGKITISD